MRNLAAVLPERVDVVLTANTFHGVEAKDVFVKPVYDSLRPGGQCVLVNWHDLLKAETPVAGRARGSPDELHPSVEKTHELIAKTFEVRKEIDLPTLLRPHRDSIVGLLPVSLRTL